MMPAVPAAPPGTEGDTLRDMSRVPLFLLAAALLAGCAGKSHDRFSEEARALGADLTAAANAFYADHGRWPREVGELEGFDGGRLRAARFRKVPVVGGLEVHYTPLANRGTDPEASLYIPPPRSWSPKGARTQPATQPATEPVTQPATSPAPQ